MADRIYLALDDIHFIHAEQLRLYGGAKGTRDEGLILSAILRPQTGYYQDLIEEAAALWESLAMNHGYVDGNKRVAFAAMLIFFGINGVELMCPPEDAIEFIYSNLEAGTFNKNVIDAFLRAHTGAAGL